MSSKIVQLLERGGLAQLTSLAGGSRTRLALGYLATAETIPTTEKAHEDAGEGHEAAVRKTDLGVADAQAAQAYYLWIADEGCLNAEAIHHHWQIPLYRLLLVQVKSAHDVWRVGLEAIQTGLFSWAFLRPSQACDVSHLRKLQLGAERNRCRVFILGKRKLPHWMFKVSIEVDVDDETNSVPESTGADRSPRGSLLLPHAQSGGGKRR